ncbi:4'-phosphopantetheinyl transferase AcpT, partial [Escherichia coli]
MAALIHPSSLNVGPDMYRIVLGKVSTLSAAPLPPGLR